MMDQEESNLNEELKRQLGELERLQKLSIEAIKGTAEHVEKGVVQALGVPALPEGVEELLTDTAASFRHMTQVHIQTTNSRFTLAMEKIHLLGEVERLKEEVLLREEVILGYMLRFGAL